jgi:putative ABC transport system substrate-binding protein
MRRREFITLLGSAAAAWPLGARGQQPEMPVVGILNSSRAENVAEFRKGLAEAGYVAGRNVAVELRSTVQYGRVAALAAELVSRRVDVIAAIGGPAAPAAKAATATIPIVFSIGGDPVELGLVPTLNRPGGNVTGVTFFAAQLLQKQIGILHELVPNAAALGILINPDNRRHQADASDAQEAARTLGVQIHVVTAREEGELQSAFVSLVERNVRALIIAGDAFFLRARSRLAVLARVYMTASIMWTREYAYAGGLMSYGTSGTDSHRQAGKYAGRILKGEKPGDLPVIQPSKFELVINLQTAKALGIEVPPMLLARADEVIE